MFSEGCYLLFGWLFVRGVSFLSCFPWAAFSSPLINICSFYLSKKKKNDREDHWLIAHHMNKKDITLCLCAICVSIYFHGGVASIL